MQTRSSRENLDGYIVKTSETAVHNSDKRPLSQMMERPAGATNARGCAARNAIDISIYLCCFSGFRAGRRFLVDDLNPVNRIGVLLQLSFAITDIPFSHTSQHWRQRFARGGQSLSVRTDRLRERSTLVDLTLRGASFFSAKQYRSPVPARADVVRSTPARLPSFVAHGKSLRH